MSQKKIRVGVLYGGRSGEHAISLRSAKSVIANLDPQKFIPVPVGIDQEGRWFINDLSVLQTADADEVLVRDANSRPAIPHADPTQELHFDVVFPVLHGKWGEDGTVQGLLELTNIPYVGCKVLGSAIGMDKDVSKRLVKPLGIPLVDYVVCFGYEDRQAIKIKIKENFSLPVFVKPANAGSSDGVSKVKQWEELDEALQQAFALDRKIMVEQGIAARDVEISVLEDLQHGTPLVSKVVGEVINTKTEYYSKQAKYDPNFFPTLKVPADLNAEQLATIQHYAAQIFIALECRGLARVDFFIEKDSGKIYFNEINTMPGFTKMSLYPIMWELSGLPYQDLLTQLINLALQEV